MKDIYQVLRDKEQAVARVRREVEALRFCLPLLGEAAAEAAATAAPVQSVPANRWPVEAEAKASNPFHN